MISPRDLPTCAAIVTDPRGEQRLVIDSKLARTEIGLLGATVLSYIPVGGKETIFVSRDAVRDGVTSVRGGIPLCFPWFGWGYRDEQMKPRHGYARSATWKVESVRDNRGTVTAVLSLSAQQVVGAPGWDVLPSSFAATLTVVSGQTLQVQLEVRNEGSVPFECERALHTYLAVHDLTATTVRGLEGVGYVEDGVEHEGSAAPIRLTGPADRIYASGANLEVSDPGNERVIELANHGSTHTVVWNPGPAAAAQMADLANDEWVSFICTETARVRDKRVTVPAGQSVTLGLTLSTRSTRRK
ncbi:D-hexose-6-phosphate mutarotase [Buchananella felis]|uniref:D-hexose-6-phosphate mutarotase n=1 Tax=Buchananella felis TaxID=3231492 RepID=UPI0035284157